MVFRPAEISEYVEWLRGYLACGGRITTVSPFPFDYSGMVTATGDFKTGGETIADALHIIVPPGIRHLGGAHGDNDLYFYDGFRHKGRTVYVYPDTEFDDLPGVAELRAKAARKHAEFDIQRAERRTRTNDSDVTSYQIATEVDRANHDPRRSMMRVLTSYLIFYADGLSGDQIPEQYRSLRLLRNTAAALEAGLEMSRWLLDHLAEETGQSKQEIARRLADALDPAD